MLLPRILTAIVLIFFTLLVLFVFPAYVFLAISALILLYGAWEWSRLTRHKGLLYNIIYLFCVFIISILLVNHLAAEAIAIVAAIMWWLIQFVFVLSFPRAKVVAANPCFAALSGLFIMIPCWLSVVNLYYLSPIYLLALFLIIWGADSFAYFTGRIWGKTKMIPNISPGKTWAGFYGAIIFSLVFAVICYIVSEPFRFHFGYLLLLFVLTTAFAILGDLVESMYKRVYGVKDSGNILPGHGGLLDRIDSLTAAAPFFLLGFALYAFV